MENQKKEIVTLDYRNADDAFNRLLKENEEELRGWPDWKLNIWGKISKKPEELKNPFIAHLEKSTERVRSWPKWKKEVMGTVLPKEIISPEEMISHLILSDEQIKDIVSNAIEKFKLRTEVRKEPKKEVVSQSMTKELDDLHKIYIGFDVKLTQALNLIEQLREELYDIEVIRQSITNKLGGGNDDANQ